MHKVANIHLEFCLEHPNLERNELEVKNLWCISFDVTHCFILNLLQMLLVLMLLYILNAQTLDFPKSYQSYKSEGREPEFTNFSWALPTSP